jgi:hypothetical protein
MKIELLHPVLYDRQEYGRGIHDLPDELARLFLNLKDEQIRTPIAVLPGQAPKGRPSFNGAPVGELK